MLARVVAMAHVFDFIRRCIRTGFCSRDLADFTFLRVKFFFNKIWTCPNHILRILLPLNIAQNYSLRNRPHNRQLPDRISRITECSSAVTMLYHNKHWLLYILALCFVLFLCTVSQFVINEYVRIYRCWWNELKTDRSWHFRAPCDSSQLLAISSPRERWRTPSDVTESLISLVLTSRPMLS